VQIEEILIQAERIVRLGLTVMFIYLIALWVAAVWWTFQDSHSRTNSIAIQMLATLFVIVFNFPGLLVYCILRPQRTLAELYAESLEEEALLRTIDDSSLCPSCRRRVEEEFLFCPWCRTRLRQRCVRCEKPMLLTWTLCPYCGADKATAPVPKPAAPAAQPATPRRPRAVPTGTTEPVGTT
jgi:RNA polymerase subunit RPABC4/transcription elongation factor Spt4